MQKEGILLNTEKTVSAGRKKKKLHIEFLRALCIWLVMFTHTSTAGFSLYIERPASFFYPLYLAVPFWVKTAVPIFFMISGALLLGKEEPISTIWKKRIWRFLQVIFVFSLINYVWFYHNLPLSIPGHIAKFFTLLYTSDLATAYYFLYIYISFLLMLPIWRKLVKVLDEKLYLYLIGLNLFFVGVMPMVSFLIFKGSAEMNYFLNPLLAVSEPTFYFLMGYWIENVLPQSWLTKRNLVKLGIAALRSRRRHDLVPRHRSGGNDRGHFRTVLRFLPLFEYRFCLLHLPLVVQHSSCVGKGGEGAGILWQHVFRRHAV